MLLPQFFYCCRSGRLGSESFLSCSLSGSPLSLGGGLPRTTRLSRRDALLLPCFSSCCNTALARFGLFLLGHHLACWQGNHTKGHVVPRVLLQTNIKNLFADQVDVRLALVQEVLYRLGTLLIVQYVPNTVARQDDHFVAAMVAGIDQNVWAGRYLLMLCLEIAVAFEAEIAKTSANSQIAIHSLHMHQAISINDTPMLTGRRGLVIKAHGEGNARTNQDGTRITGVGTNDVTWR